MKSERQRGLVCYSLPKIILPPCLRQRVILLRIIPYKKIEASFFDRTVEPTLCVPKSIDQSAVNFYAPEFTNKDFELVDAVGQSTLNAYFYLDATSGKPTPKYQKYHIGGKYDKELQVAVYWLQRAYEHAQKYPAQFDIHFQKSLAYLIEYLTTGDEEIFKQHSIEWLQSSSKIDYVYGYIETYDDPKGYRPPLFQSDVTIKSVDIDKLNALLPDLEERLPFRVEFKRSTVQGTEKLCRMLQLMFKAFTAGSLGPLNLTLAYCLPNYEEIRSMHGSKQIIYHAAKSMVNC